MEEVKKNKKVLYHYAYKISLVKIINELLILKNRVSRLH